jgi:SAM-dependent methyltransferase
MGNRISDTGFVGAEHEFHDEAFAVGWSERFVPTAPRLRLFDAMVEQLRGTSATAGRVVELGVGPGYLAEHVLANLPAVQYIAVDFSEPFLSIARRRLARFAGRVTYVQADLLSDNWPDEIKSPPVDACVSTWALHDLGSQEATSRVYRDCAGLLAADGVLLNGDFVKPEGTAYQFEAGRFEVSRHREMLRSAGFTRCECLEIFELEIERPTPAQNYALLVGRR